MSKLRSHPVPRYALAILCTVLATVISLLLGRYFAHGILSFYLIAVLASAWVGGLWPGLLTTVLSVLSIDYFFLIPLHSFSVQSADDLAEIVVFSLVAVAVSFLQTAQKKAKHELQSLNERLEERVKQRTSWLSLAHDITGAAQESETADQALRFALKRLTSDRLWRYAQIYTPAPDDPQALSPSYAQAATDDPGLRRLQESTAGLRIRLGQGPVGRVWETGALEWIAEAGRESEHAGRGFAGAGLQSAIVFPLLVGRKVVAVVECWSGDRMEREPQLTDLMAAVGIELGMIVERKQLQEGYSEAVWQQQRRTAQELHDGLGQRLTGLWLLGTSLRERLKETDHEPLARKVSDGLEQALEEIRGIAKGVFPVDLDSQGLMAALKDLVAVMGSASGVACRFECPEPVPLEDNRVALHLYRIAQEAITNALKHGRPREVVVSLKPMKNGIELCIGDDGTGIPGPPERREGAGLRIMRYRAAAMDATLRIESRPGGGTLVMCVSPAKPTSDVRREHAG